ncbi:MAG TPA: ATP-binding cassette domain-containing protein [Kofleriaceae bacterium]|nr:ATP-binding cassette domain-containing protein [Kofleriaceae bacterium]
MNRSADVEQFRLERVSRRWGDRPALEEVSLTIRPGERILLAGPSGSGKTTLLRLLAGVLRPSSGTIHVEGVDLMGMGPRQVRRHRARCAIVEQGALLVPQSDVHHNVLAGRVATMPWHAIVWSALWRTESERVRELLARVGLADRQWDSAGNLSGGQQQRVAIARALIASPAILLADEPTSSLDPATARDVTDLLLEQAGDGGATLVFCSHWISIARDRVHRVLGIRGGRVVLDARPEDVGKDALDSLYRGSREQM